MIPTILDYSAKMFFLCMYMKGTIQYEFSAEVWRYPGPGGWFFVSLPQKMAMEIRDSLKWQEAGWGRLSAWAKIGASRWETAIWFDAKQQTYLLPLKAEIRKKENIEQLAVVDVVLYL